MKILVISHEPFSPIYCNGKTLRSMFSAFKREELAQLFFKPCGEPDVQVCENFFYISDSDVFKKVIGKQKKCGEVYQRSSTYLEVKQRNVKFYSKVPRNMLLRDVVWSTNVWKTKELEEWYKQIKPDLILFVAAGSKFPFLVTKYLSNLDNTPVACFLMDDYYLHVHVKNLFEYLQRKLLYKYLKRLIDESVICFGIGDQLCEEYKECFGKEFYPIMNSIPIQEYNEPHKNEDKIIISYFGGLHLDRWKMISRLSSVIDPVFEVRVYTADNLTEEQNRLFADSRVCYCGSLSGIALKQAMTDSDVLLHVESDDISNRTYTRLSVSTKIPEYLMSGRVLLGYGPEEVASMQLLIKNNVGLFISSETTDDEIKKKIEIIKNHHYRVELGKKAYGFAVKKFDNKLIAENFKCLLRNNIK